jgi:hypothetical protein
VKLNEDEFVIGDLVEIFSVLSQERFLGLLSSLSAEELMIRSFSGTRLRVPRGLLVAGSIKLTHDTETAEQLQLISQFSK